MNFDAAEIASWREAAQRCKDADSPIDGLDPDNILALLDELEKARDSYNCNTAIMHARTAALRKSEAERDAARAQPSESDEARARALSEGWIPKDQAGLIVFEASVKAFAAFAATIRAEARRATAKQFGACMSCFDGSPDPMGCTDCLGTGYDGGAPSGFISEKTHEAIIAEATLAGAKAERERCARIADLEKVDWDTTQDDSDKAYNTACDHIAAAIRRAE